MTAKSVLWVCCYLWMARYHYGSLEGCFMSSETSRMQTAKDFVFLNHWCVNWGGLPQLSQDIELWKETETEHWWVITHSLRLTWQEFSNPGTSHINHPCSGKVFYELGLQWISAVAEQNFRKFLLIQTKKPLSESRKWKGKMFVCTYPYVCEYQSVFCPTGHWENHESWQAQRIYSHGVVLCTGFNIGTAKSATKLMQYQLEHVLITMEGPVHEPKTGI